MEIDDDSNLIKPPLQATKQGPGSLSMSAGMSEAQVRSQEESALQHQQYLLSVERKRLCEHAANYTRADEQARKIIASNATKVMKKMANVQHVTKFDEVGNMVNVLRHLPYQFTKDAFFILGGWYSKASQTPDKMPTKLSNLFEKVLVVWKASELFNELHGYKKPAPERREELLVELGIILSNNPDIFKDCTWKTAGVEKLRHRLASLKSGLTDDIEFELAFAQNHVFLFSGPEAWHQFARFVRAYSLVGHFCAFKDSFCWGIYRPAIAR